MLLMPTVRSQKIQTEITIIYVPGFHCKDKNGRRFVEERKMSVERKKNLEEIKKFQKSSQKENFWKRCLTKKDKQNKILEVETRRLKKKVL